MGDRCLVDLTVLTVHVDKVLSLTDGDRPNETSEEDDCTVMSFEEVNYGTLNFLSELTDAGIAWDSRWHGGDEYGPGTKHVRFAADGSVQEVEYGDEEEGKVQTSAVLMWLDQPGITIDAVRANLHNHIAAFQPLPWEGQEENGKRHLALKLIGGT